MNKLIIWGGWDKEDKKLTLNEIDSHASVYAYFLTKYLKEYFEIINITNFYDIDEAVEHDAPVILSTFQAGFTKLQEQGLLWDEFRRFKLCSIVDGIYWRNYVEDILFTVQPCNETPWIKRLGWLAEPELCYPDGVNYIFIDHPGYSFGQRLFDRSKWYYKKFKELPLILRQDKFGVGGIADYNNEYKRYQKVPYLEMLEYYRKTAIFCVTHPETGALSTMEAAMSGAMIYVPRVFKPFIPYALLKEVPHRIIDFAWQLDSVQWEVVDRNVNYEKLKHSHSWKRGAERIRDALNTLV